ncbi:MAG: glutamate racemase [Defluviitaleaceae bacterium]|nr:glutamate racemase [Defluviitaleaceae bacterium]
MDDRPIGIFDSGVGGLTVAHQLRRVLPHESTIYVGDTARVPYGSKTKETLLSYGRDIIKFLLTKNVKAVILACGTSSANTYQQLQEEFPQIKLIDVLRPGVAACASMLAVNPQLRLGLIATEATVRSGLFETLLKEKSPTANIISRPCPLFASMVEAGHATKPGDPILQFVSDNYLADLRGQIDALVLGCTHYPLLTAILTATLGQIQFINLAESTAAAAKTQLSTQLSTKTKPTHQFYVSGSTEIFQQTAKQIFGEDCVAGKVEY